MVVSNDWEVPSSRFNHAPHGMTGAPTRFSPTWVEFQSTGQALVERLAARVYIEAPTSIDASVIADRLGFEQAISGRGSRTTLPRAKLQVHARLFSAVALATGLTAGARGITGVDPDWVSVEGLLSVIPVLATTNQLILALESDVISAPHRVSAGDPTHLRVFKLHWAKGQPFAEILE